MRVLCINDSGRPDDVPVNKWVKKDEPYTVVDVLICNTQPGRPTALILAEIDLTGCGAYKGFDSSRFRIIQLEPAGISGEEIKKEQFA